MVKNKILFVDDEPFILSSIRRSIASITDEWELHFAESGPEALEACDGTAFDLIVTDGRMPQMGGSELLRLLRERPDTGEVPTIMLTGYTDEEMKRSAIKAGVIEFINKPVMTDELIQRLRNVLRLKSISDELKRKNGELKEFSKQLIRRLGKAAEYRDNETGKHVIRVAHYCGILTEGIRLPADTAESIFLTAPMHDIGKIGIPDEILKKKEKLKPIEFEVIKSHSMFGGLMLEPLNQEEMKHYYSHMEIGASILGEQDTPLLKMAATIAMTHHEKWDGTGYPKGLRGEDIPLEGRIVALADVFDALTSRRYYKPAIPEEESIKILNELGGTHLDPSLMRCFNENLHRFHEVRSEFAEP